MPAAAAPAAVSAASADMVRVSAGEFLMGSADSDKLAKADEKPQHTVYLDEFWIDQTEVTNAAFARFVQATGYKTTGEQPNHPGGIVCAVSTAGWSWNPTKGTDWRHPSGPSSSIDARPDYPVVQVSWADAAAYCAWAGKRLPSEAEWEKAATGRGRAALSLGQCLEQQPGQYIRNRTVRRSGCGQLCIRGEHLWRAGYGGQRLGVGGRLVWHEQLCRRRARNPEGPSSGMYRVLRGGGWDTGADYARTAKRSPYMPSILVNYLGFRCARGSAP